MAGGSVTTGWLPDPENWPLWHDLLALLDTAAVRGGVPAWQDGDLAWLAIDGGQVIGAVTTRLIEGGDAEIKHIAGVRCREWYPQLEAQICDWARDCGAPFIISRGRLGWVPLVTRLGWEVVGMEDGLTLFEKRL